MNYVRAGYVFLNNEPVGSIQVTMEVGRDYHLELRFPNGVNIGTVIRLVTPTYYKARINKPDTAYRRA